MRRILTLVATALCILAAGAGGAACGGIAATTTSTTSTSLADPPVGPRSTGPLSAPKTSVASEADYLKDVAAADPVLATYADDDGSVALRALLTDGSAFCAFLARGGGIDDAMVSLAIGVKGVEKTTHLPSTVTTFNTIEASALLTLCPSEQVLVPVADRNKLRSLGEALAGTAG